MSSSPKVTLSSEAYALISLISRFYIVLINYRPTSYPIHVNTYKFPVYNKTKFIRKKSIRNVKSILVFKGLVQKTFSIKCLVIHRLRVGMITNVELATIHF